MNQWLSSAIFLSVVILVGLIVYLFLFFFYQVDLDWSNTPPSEQAIEKKLAKERLSFKKLKFDLVDPHDAPDAIRKAVEEGYQLMLHTHEKIPQYAPHPINCTNCHFAGGLTLGGMGGGISLAGVAAKYPALNNARGRVESLAQRINDCFIYSLNGNPLPFESEEMLAFLTYFQWISSNYPIYQPTPWLGLNSIKPTHQPNLIRGRAIYEIRCATCHGQNGEGKSVDGHGMNIPAIFGEKSFNNAAGMGHLRNLASFVYHNMPFEEPHLSEEEAWDVSAFILQQPRPIFSGS
ncbi:MAG: c-type cytochrome [Parachlamydiaceae bacterium]